MTPRTPRQWTFAGLFILLAAQSLAANPLALQLADIYRDGIDVADYWVSEKLDGVRARWDGTRLISRQGNAFAAPDWFTDGFPSVALDGELWIGRGRFERISGIVRRLEPEDRDWRSVHFMVFDLPNSPLPFSQRLTRLRKLIGPESDGRLRLIEQFRVADRAELMRRLQQVVDSGGEGLMLHHQDALYRSGRVDHLLKLKPYRDAEATVIGHLPGKGKYRGMLGALLVESPDGRRFRLGSGLSDAQRRSPPPVGSLVTYKFHGLTRNGLPRFASFLRVRRDAANE